MDRDRVLSVLPVVTRMVTSEIEDYGYYDDEAPHIRPKASLADLGLDDSAAFHLLIEAEQIFGVSLSDNTITLKSTIADIVSVIKDALRAKGSPRST